MPNDFRQNNSGFDLTYEKDGVYLTVHKSVDFSSRINETELLNVLNRKKIRELQRKSHFQMHLKAVTGSRSK